MRRDQDDYDYDPTRDRYVEHDTRNVRAGVVVLVVIAACLTVGFAIGIAAIRMIAG